MFADNGFQEHYYDEEEETKCSDLQFDQNLYVFTIIFYSTSNQTFCI